MLTPLLNVHVAVCAPPNDNCAAATPVGNVTNLHFNTMQATFDGPGICTYVDGANIWYRYTATETGCVTVSLCGSLYDTKLAVYYGASCPVTQARLIECNDDYCDRQSQVSFQAIAGTQYLIEIGGFSDRTGQGLMSISSCSEPPYPPPVRTQGRSVT